MASLFNTCGFTTVKNELPVVAVFHQVKKAGIFKWLSMAIGAKKNPKHEYYIRVWDSTIGTGKRLFFRSFFFFFRICRLFSF